MSYSKHPKLRKGIKKLYGFFDELSEALEDGRISVVEGVKLTPELLDFLGEVKHKDEIIKEFKELSEEEKLELAVDLFRKTRANYSKELVQCFERIISNLIKALELFRDIFEDCKQAKLMLAEQA